MIDDHVKEAVGTAIEALKAEGPVLDFGDVHERSTAHRLAVHLEKLFKGWNVDCEYDRDGQTQKELMGIKDCKSSKTTDIILPDIIVHQRQGKGRDHNLFVIELKRRTEEDACEHEKLKRLTAPNGHYQYQLSLYINIDGGRFACTWYKDGKQE